MSKTKAARSRSKSKSQAKSKTKPLYGGKSYGLIWIEGSKAFTLEDDLIARCAKKLGKPQARVMHDYRVLCNKNHTSNGGRSEVQVNDEGLVKLVAIKQTASKAKAKTSVSKVKKPATKTKTVAKTVKKGKPAAVAA